jgi:iron complex outermembrane recepter protein
MKNFFLSIITISISLSLFSQSNLTGKVINAATGNPLAGASVSLASAETMTDSEGRFSIICSKAAKLTVSYVGYETYQQTIKSCNDNISVALIPFGRSLKEVEITATSSANKSLLYQPASITKLSPAELKRGTGLFLDDAIQTNVPGVSMNRRSVSGGQQLNIRGYGNGSRGTRGISSNFDGQGYKVYFNGIPVTDAEGITTFDDLDFGSIGNVEITKGPAGTLYGLAIAGAVNLSTIKPEKGKTSLGQEVIIGNYGLRRYTTQFQMGRENTSLLLNYGHQKSDGFSIHNKSRKDFANAFGDFKLNEKQALNTYVGYSNSYDERLGELTLAQYANNDYSGNPEYIKRDAHSGVISFRAGVGHIYHFTNNISNTTSVFGTGLTSNASSAGGWTDKNTINYGFRSSFDTRFSLGNVVLSGITGVELQRQDGQTIGYNFKADPNDPNPGTWIYGVSPFWVINTNTSNVATISKTSSLFTQWTLALPHDFSVTAGIGLSGMNIILNDRFNAALATRPTHYEKSYTGLLSPHVAINKVFNKQFSVYASYSKGYKAPVSSYFYITTPAAGSIAATGRLNTVLKPEIGNQFEIGSKGQTTNNKLVYEVVIFHTVFSNKMTTVPVQSTPTTTAYNYMINGGDQIHKGVEVLVKYSLLQSKSGFITMLRPFANLTYSNFTYGDNFLYRKGFAEGDTVDYSNKAVVGVPKIVANLGFDLMTKYGIYANLTYNYKDPIVISYANSDVVYNASSYNLLNAKIGIQHSLGSHFDVDAYAGVTNLTNTKYYLMVFVNQLPDAYIPAPKNANYFGGINLKYNF